MKWTRTQCATSFTITSPKNNFRNSLAQNTQQIPAIKARLNAVKIHHKAPD